MPNYDHIYIKFDHSWEVIEISESLNFILNSDALTNKKLGELFNKNLLNTEGKSFNINLPKGSENEFECLIHRLGDYNVLTGYNLNKQNSLASQLDNVEIVSDMNMSKLQKVNDLLNDANSIKELFLSKVSHELRTPLNAVMGFSEVLRKNPNANTKYYINLIESNARLLHTYVEDLLLFSKSNQAEIKLKPHAFSPTTLVQGVLELVKINPEYTSKNIDFVVNSEFSDTLILEDEVRFRQIIINLVNNALKFTIEGKVELSIINQNNKAIQIILTDTGIGISEEHQKNIFNEYQQVETLNEHKGLGLGLSIVKSIVEAMKGEIKLESKIGEGTTFEISLPLTLISSDEVNNDETLIDGFDKITNKKILYVEDSITNQKVFQAFLKEGGHIVEIASNFDEGISMHEKSNYDAIFIDVTLGAKDGKELITKIREVDETTPLVSLTAHTTENEQVKCFNAGADYFLAKPFNMKDLNNALAYCNNINRGFEFSRYMQQFSNEEDFQKNIVKLSLEELKNNVNILADNKSEGYENLLPTFLHKSKTAVHTLDHKNVNSIIDYLKIYNSMEQMDYEDNLRPHIFKLKNQINRLGSEFLKIGSNQ